MIFRILRYLLIAALILAPLPNAAAGWLPLVKSGGGGGCAEATALTARMDGAQNTAAVTTLICGMVTDGTYSLLDGLYVFATNSTGNATLNWAQNSFNLTWTSLVNCTFSANSGITGDASTCFANTGFTPSTAGGNWTLSSTTMGSCIVNARSVSQNYVTMGADQTGSLFSYQQPFTSGAFFFDISSAFFPSFANTNTQGSWITTRQGGTAATNITLYLNGSSVATPSDSSSGLTPFPIYILGLDDGGSAADLSADKVAYALFGAGMTSTQVGNVRSRLNTYIAAVGGSGC